MARMAVWQRTLHFLQSSACLRDAGDAIHLCLAGFVAAIRVSCLLGMGMLRSTFVTSVARFTLLHAPGQMQAKNAKAFRALLVAADENGNHLHVRPPQSTVLLDSWS